MTIYPDPSIIIAAFVNEPNRDKARAFLTGQLDTKILTSWWTYTEISSALGVKVRTGDMRLRVKASVLTGIREQLSRSSIMVLPVKQDFERAADYMEQTDVALRAGDALHLAIAAQHAAIAWTFDRRMAEAGQALGLGTRLLA